jgi:hypothetical protein
MSQKFLMFPKNLPLRLNLMSDLLRLNPMSQMNLMWLPFQSYHSNLMYSKLLIPLMSHLFHLFRLFQSFLNYLKHHSNLTMPKFRLNQMFLTTPKYPKYPKSQSFLMCQILPLSHLFLPFRPFQSYPMFQKHHSYLQCRLFPMSQKFLMSQSYH